MGGMLARAQRPPRAELKPVACPDRSVEKIHCATSQTLKTLATTRGIKLGVQTPTTPTRCVGTAVVCCI